MMPNTNNPKNSVTSQRNIILARHLIHETTHFLLERIHYFGDHLELAKYIPIKNIKTLYNLYMNIFCNRWNHHFQIFIPAIFIKMH